MRSRQRARAGAHRPMRAAPWWLACALGASGLGCSSDVDVGLGLEAQAAVMVVLAPDEALAFAVEGTPQEAEVRSAGDVQVYVLEYAADLAALGLQEGPLDLVEAPAGVPFPPASRIIERRIEGSGVREPAELTELPEALLAYHLAVPEIVTCLDGGGCLAPRFGDERLVCKIPCDDPSAVAPPIPPEPPNLVCPTGWVIRPGTVAEEVGECDPWENEINCASGFAQRPGESRCQRVGPDCPAGRWPAPPVASDARYYVDAAAAPGGDGTEGRPFSAISEVPTDDAGTTLVLLATGDYTVPANLPDPVVFAGACATRTDLGVVELSGGDVGFFGVGFDRLEAQGAAVRLDGVLIETRSLRGLWIRGGTLVADDLRVQGGALAGLVVSDAATASVTLARIENGSVTAEGGARLELSDSIVDGGSYGALARAGGTATLARVVLRDSRTAGVTTETTGSRVNLTDVLVTSRPGFGRGLTALSGSVISGSRVVLRSVSNTGLAADAARIQLTDLVVRDTQPDPVERRYGTAVQAAAGAVITIERALLLRNQGFGVLAIESATEVALTDTRIIEVLPWEVDGERGTGIAVNTSAMASLSRVYMHRSRGMGLIAENQASVTGGDLEIDEVLPRDSNGAYGRGIEVDEGSSVRLDRVRVSQAKNIAVHVLQPLSKAVFTDLTVVGTTRSMCFDFSCNAGVADGLIATLEGTLEAERFLVDGNGQYGVRIVNRSRLALKDGTISNNPVGAQIISDDYDLGLLTEGVRFVGNEENLTSLIE